MTSGSLENDLKAAIRSIPDYPKPGIIFRDITTLLGDARAFRRAIDDYLERERAYVEAAGRELLDASPYRKDFEEGGF